MSLSIRPEKIHLRADDDAGNGLSARIDRPIYLGTDTHYQVALNGEESTFLVRIQNAHDARVFEPGQAVGLVVDPQSARMLVD